MELKAEFVQMGDQPNAYMSKLCRRFGISRPTEYKWLRRYQAEGLKGLAERSRRPHHSTNKTPEAIEQLIIETRREDPDWGRRKLRRHLINQAAQGAVAVSPEQIPSASTITKILDRHQMLAAPTDPSLRAGGNALSGLVPMSCGSWTSKGSSRFSLAMAACPNQQRSMTVQKHLRNAFCRYGLPKAILCVTVRRGEPASAGAVGAPSTLDWPYG